MVPPYIGKQVDERLVGRGLFRHRFDSNCLDTRCTTRWAGVSTSCKPLNECQSFRVVENGSTDDCESQTATLTYLINTLLVKYVPTPG